MLISLIGTWIQSVAQSWLIFELTRSAFLLGFVGFLNSIPLFLFSLFGGVLADRLNKRNILIVTQISFMALAFALALLTQFKLITPAQIMALAVLNGVVMAFDAPSRQSMVVELVGKAHLPNAIALNSVAFNSSRIIGPAIAAVLVSAIGMSGCFYINGVSFLAVIIALFAINIKPKSARPGKAASAMKDLKDGLVFVKNNSTILVLIAIVGIVSLFGVSYVVLMPIFANDVLRVGVKGLGVLMSCAGFGALIGALILARLGDYKHKGWLLFGSSFIFSAALIIFALSRMYIVSLAALVFVGGASVIAVSLINMILQTGVPDEYRGRVMSVFMLTFAGMLPFGNLIAGALAQSFGVSAAIMAGGICCTIFFCIINIFFPGIRKL